MARIAGVELQDQWKLPYALTKIKGIGWSRANEILKDLKFNFSSKISELKPEEVSRIAARVEDYVIEGELIRQVRNNVQRLKTIGSYRGIRHARNLPVRGQKTRRNARTKRGKRKTVGAFKKEALSRVVSGKEQKEV